MRRRADFAATRGRHGSGGSKSWGPVRRVVVIGWQRWHAARWRHLLLILTVCLPVSGRAQQSEGPSRPTTGREVPELRVFDRAVRSLMAEHGIPGASLAVAREGRLVLARGYGFADTSSREPVRPSHRFRIASVTKPVTAAAILTLVEKERLGLEDRPFEILGHLVPPGGSADPRIPRITVRHLLRHRGGFDRRRSIDPTLVPGAVADSLGVDPPVDIEQVIRFMLGRPLDFDPGSRTVYSNFGYAVLGRLIEEVTGRSYETFVREAVLEPAGAEGVEVGRSFPADRPRDEVSYYHPGPPGLVPAIPPAERRVALPDGGFDLELMAAHGGLIATPTDLLRFLTAVDGSGSRADILTPATVRRMTSPPEGACADSACYAMGWNVRPPSDDASVTWWHGGDLPGTTALLMRSGPTAWAFLVNRSPWDRGAHETIRRVLRNAARAVASWPAHDLFGRSRAVADSANGGDGVPEIDGSTSATPACPMSGADFDTVTELVVRRAGREAPRSEKGGRRFRRGIRRKARTSEGSQPEPARYESRRRGRHGSRY